MVGSSRETCPTIIKNLDAAIIELEPARDQSLAKDIIEIATGVSSNAAAAGGKITAGTIIYAGHEPTPDQQLANNIFWVGSLVVTVIDFLMVPLGYLYKLYKKEPVPFNFDNNTKWALAGVTLLLAIISAAVAAAARAISFVSAGLAITVGIASVCKYFYDYKKTGRELEAAMLRVAKLTEEIQLDMEAINNLQNQIRLMDINNPAKKTDLRICMIQLANTYRKLNLDCEELKASYFLMHQLERKFIRQKSPVELISTSIKFVLAGIVLAGTVVVGNPVTAGIGMWMLASAALFSLVTIIAKKAVQIIEKRIEREHEKKRNRKIEIRSMEPSANSTTTIFQSLNTTPAPTPPAAASAPKAEAATSPPAIINNKNEKNDELTASPAKPAM